MRKICSIDPLVASLLLRVVFRSEGKSPLNSTSVGHMILSVLDLQLISGSAPAGLAQSVKY